jgi:hypothetical protein
MHKFLPIQIGCDSSQLNIRIFHFSRTYSLAAGTTIAFTAFFLGKLNHKHYAAMYVYVLLVWRFSRDNNIYFLLVSLSCRTFPVSTIANLSTYIDTIGFNSSRSVFMQKRALETLIFSSFFDAA